MSERYKFRDPRGAYFTTSTIVGWVDVFTRPELKHVVIDSLKYCQTKKGLSIHGWCLMTSHLHLICSTHDEDLSSIFRDFKKHTANEILTLLDTTEESRRGWVLDLFGEVGDGLKRISNFKVWQDGNHPIHLSTAALARQKLDYIHNNPVAEEIVREPEDYLYSSAADYGSNRKGLLEIDFLY